MEKIKLSTYVKKAGKNPEENNSHHSIHEETLTG